MFVKKLQPHNLSIINKISRVLWHIVWRIFYRPTPRSFHLWRCLLLKIFGAQIGKGVHPYPTAKIWAPWNLVMGDYSCISENVDCYNVALICIGKFSIISQYSFLCTASHDYSKASMPLVIAPILIGDNVWVTADVFVAPGVSIGAGAVITARSSVFSDIPSWVVAKGNPAIVVKERLLNEQ